MDRIFAPWRIEWIRREDKNPDVDDCVFCELPDRNADRDNRIVARSSQSYVMLNNSPYNPGHVMVIPTPHAGSYAELEEPVLFDHARLKQRTFDALEAGFEPDGFNAGLNLGTGSGGSIADHLHTHIVPRWEGDTNFMPVIGETKVIVEALDETYEQLYEAFADQSEADASTDGAVEFG